MSTVSKQDLIDAITCVVSQPSPRELVREVRGIVTGWATHPLRYDGHLTPLNAFISVGVRDMAAFDRLMGLVEQKLSVTNQSKRSQYLADQMRIRRARAALAIALAELRQGPLSKYERDRYIKDQQARWQGAKQKATAGLDYDANLKAERKTRPSR